MHSSAFGPMTNPFAMNMPVIDPNNPMNVYYRDQAIAHAQRCPQDPFAQALAHHWAQAVEQIEAARRQSQAAPPLAPAAGLGHQGAPAPVPSNAFPEAPTPPQSPMPTSPHFGAPR